MSDSKMSNGTKLALGLGAVAGVGVFLFSRSSSAATDEKKPLYSDKDLAELKANGCRDGAADKAAGFESKVPLDREIDGEKLPYAKAYQECYKMGTIPVTDKTPPKTTPPKTTTPVPTPGKYSPSMAKDKVRAHSLAVAIGHAPPIGVPFGCPDPLAIGGQSYCSLAAFTSYDPNRAGLAALQEASGLPANGLYDSMTQQAFDYWYSHTS